MKIILTKHAQKKFKDLARLGIHVTPGHIAMAIDRPIHIDTETDYPNIVVSGDLNRDHIVRVGITFYPARKRRYFS